MPSVDSSSRDCEAGESEGFLASFTDAVLYARDLDTSQSRRTQSVASALNNNYYQDNGISPPADRACMSSIGISRSSEARHQRRCQLW